MVFLRIKNLRIFQNANIIRYANFNIYIFLYIRILCYDRKIQITIYNQFFNKQIEYSFEKFLHHNHISSHYITLQLPPTYYEHYQIHAIPSLIKFPQNKSNILPKFKPILIKLCHDRCSQLTLQIEHTIRLFDESIPVFSVYPCMFKFERILLVSIRDRVKVSLTTSTVMVTR